MTDRTRAKRMISAGVALSDAAQRLGIPLGTLKSWASRNKWTAKNATARATATPPHPVTAEPPKPQWMRSLHHDWAHLVGADGQAVCNAAPYFGQWFPAEDTRRCKRCMGHQS